MTAVFVCVEKNNFFVFLHETNQLNEEGKNGAAKETNLCSL